MIRIAFIADSHFDSSPGGRFEECVRLHNWIASDLEERGVDLILHGGDLYERRSGIAERNAAAAWLQRVAEIAPVVLVRGNHDAAADLQILGELETREPIYVAEAPTVINEAGVSVACLPWPRKAELLARLGSEVSPEQAGAVAQAALRDVIRGLGSEMATYHPGDARILLAHAMVRGSRTSQGQPLIGSDMELGLEDLALAGADLVLLGHIHCSQEWTWERDDGAVPILYAGSPRRTAFGEMEPKGYVLATFEGARLVGWERVWAPAQRMALFTGYYQDGQLDVEGDHADLGDYALGPEGDEPGADVRVRYEVAADEREQARAAAEEFRRELLETWGAERVKVEEVVRPTTRSRESGVAEAKTLPEKLAALWRLRGEDLGEREPRVLGRLEQLEGA